MLGAKGTMFLTPLSGRLVYGPGHGQTDSYHTEYEVLSVREICTKKEQLKQW